MTKPRASDIPARPETDTRLHWRIFKREGYPAPPYSTDELTAEWLAEQYDLASIPVMGGLQLEEVQQFMGVRRLQPDEKPDSKLGFESLAEGETKPLALARSVLVLEGLAEREFETYEP